MKKTLISTLLASTFGLLSLQATAADLQEIYQLATQKDPQLLKAVATRDAAKHSIDVSKARLLPQVNLTAGYSKSMSESAQFIDGSLVPIDRDNKGWNAEVVAIG